MQLESANWENNNKMKVSKENTLKKLNSIIIIIFL